MQSDARNNEYMHELKPTAYLTPCIIFGVISKF